MSPAIQSRMCVHSFGGDRMLMYGEAGVDKHGQGRL